MVGLPFEFPSVLPLFFDAQRQFGFVPHVEDSGFICFTRNENLVIDERYPGKVVLDCLEKVIGILEMGQLEANNQDFLEEFEVYWQRSDACYREAHVLFDEENNTIREIDLYLMSLDGVTYFVCEKSFNPDHYIQSVFKEETKNVTKRRCLFIPLREGTFIKPSQVHQKWTFKELKELVYSNITSEDRKKLVQLIQRNPKSNTRYDYVLFGLPINQEKNALFGMVIHYEEGMIKSKKTKVQLHPLIQTPVKIEVFPFAVTRHHKDFLLARTGADSSFVGKHAIVIGVGAIGSVVAMGLAKSGFGTITLIDHDRIDIENVYRHVLGADLLYNRDTPNELNRYKKVEALKIEIERKYPLTKVIAIDKKFNTVLEMETIDWDKADIIIVCMGSPNAEMAINRHFHQLSQSPPLIHAWVEPFGVGGHVLLTLNQEKQGCYQCLFRPLSDEDSIENLSGFAQAGQSFTKSLGGCGTYFTPYSFLDSEETANQVLRTIHRLSRKQIKGNPIFSWKGDPTLFLNEGFKLSDRFHMTEEQLMKNSTLYYDPNCPVCSNKETPH